MNEHRQNLIEQLGIKKMEKELTNFDWLDISRFCKLSEDFIREFNNEVKWNYISLKQVLSEDFIREFIDEIKWYAISKHQILSENFISEFANQVDWWAISRYQKLSNEFLNRFKNDISWADYFYYHESDISIMKSHILKSGYRNINEFKTYHLNENEIKEIERLLTLQYMFTN